MLTDINIKNIAIIDNLHVTFGPGLNVLTGETGAGKSIIIDAVSLLMGVRASADIIRAGTEEAVVEAIFDISGRPELVDYLAEVGLETDVELLIKRVVSASGKNKVFINGGLSTLNVLSDVARRCINIYGQHEAQTLLKPDNHLLLLDGFAGCGGLRREYGELFAQYRRIVGEIRKLEEGEKERSRRIDLLTFQSAEIAEAQLISGEEEELEQERQILSHAERILSATRGGYELIYDGDDALLGQLKKAIDGISGVTVYDPQLIKLKESLESGYLQMEDAALSLRDYASRIEADPARLQQVDDRLDQIGRLKKKYGAFVEDVLAYKEAVEKELAMLLNVTEARGELENKQAELSKMMREEGRRLSEARQKGAAALSSAMTRELHDLSMPSAIFTVDFEELKEPRSTGAERVEFLFSPNPGEPPRPLARIASGGELSRLMLALKQIHPESDVPTLVFDEVDTGIGGATSAMVGRKLKKVAKSQQVLCITHLPQVAAHADRHYRVEKRQDNGRTITDVALTSAEGQVAELARMLGGVTITQTTLNHAREMIAEANHAGR